MIDYILKQISWMQWTLPSIIFLGGIFLSIAVIGIVENYIPVVERKGFLPIPTTPGDRLFISILYLIGVFLLWILFFAGNLLWIPALIAAAGVLLIAFYG